ncbi:hypothetical protein JCM10295v2_003160 [Rhodotorula toruloides]
MPSSSVPTLSRRTISRYTPQNPTRPPPPPSKGPLENEAAALAKVKDVKAVYDEDIPVSTIVIVDPTNGHLLPPTTLRSILAALDRDRYKLLLVDRRHKPPICRIIDKEEEKRQALERRQKEKERKADKSAPGAGSTKEVHVTWGVSPHDLQHKLKKGRGFLEKGYRLLVVIESKKGVPPIDKQGQGAVLKQIATILEGVGRQAGAPSGTYRETQIEFAPKPQQQQPQQQDA